MQIAASLAVLDVPWVIKPLYGVDFGFPAVVRLSAAQLSAAGQCRRGRRLPVDHPGAGAGSDRVRAAADGDRDGRLQHGVRRAAGGERPEASARVQRSSTSNGCGSTSRSMVASLAGGGLIEVLSAAGALHAAAAIAAVAPIAVIVSSIALVDEQRAGINHRRTATRAAGLHRYLPLAHAVADRGFPVLLLFQPRLWHAALFPHDRPPALFAGHDRHAVIGERRRVDRGRAALPLAADAA